MPSHADLLKHVRSRDKHLLILSEKGKFTPGIHDILSSIDGIVADVAVQAHEVQPPEASARDGLLRGRGLECSVHAHAHSRQCMHYGAPNAPHDEAHGSVLRSLDAEAAGSLRQREPAAIAQSSGNHAALAHCQCPMYQHHCTPARQGIDPQTFHPSILAPFA